MSPASNADIQKLKRRLADWRVPRSDVKAFRYVGKFFDRQRHGQKIIAKVEGNFGIYTVSINVSGKEEVDACSCYIGKDGGCHHCRALAQTFLNDPRSFVPKKTRSRKQIRSVDDIKVFLDSVTLEQLISQIQQRGVTQKKLAEILGMNYRLLGSAKLSEKRNRFYGFLGAVKLACLRVLEQVEKEKI